MMTVDNFIGGSFVPPASGRLLDDVEPATGGLLARIPRSGPDDVQAAVAAARAAFDDGWARSNVKERADLIDAIADGIQARFEQFVALESQDQGKPRDLARAVDIPRAVNNFRFFAGAVRHDRDDAFHMDGALNYTLRQPLGVVGLITPWNLPLYLLTWKVAPSLAMGNCIVAKPSELTPLTADLLAQVFADVGAPAGVFNLVHGLGPEVGQAIVEHPGIKAISFTGGTATGRIVAATGAPMFKKLSLELGGKNATLVFADADLDQAVDGATRAAFANQGEICLCGSRILVQRPIYHAFVAGLIARAKTWTAGDPAEPGTRVGALVSEAHRDKVASYLDLAVEEGGTVHCGGPPASLPERCRDGFFLEPAVITGLPTTCRTATEEIFGPVVTVHPFDTEAEAVAIANGVVYGLSASVWTSDLATAHRVARDLETGMVWVNTWLKRDLRVPFGGVKDSGVGREGGRYSLEFFSESRNICIELGTHI